MTIIIKTGILFMNIIYTFFKFLPTQKKMTIISRQGDHPSMDITMLANKTSDLYPDYNIVVLCKKINKTISSIISYSFHMLKQMYHISTSEVVVLDSYCILASILKHKKSLLIIQMWHSVGTMKKFGYSVLDKPEGSSSKIAHAMKMHRNYDYIFSAGHGYRAHLAEGFNYPLEKIIVMPLPRIEALKDDNYSDRVRNDILNAYPCMKEKKNIIYVPTFRKNDNDDFITALNELCSSVDYNKYNLIIKPHPLTDLSDFKNKNAILDRNFSSFDMLFAGDIIVSDYSCIIYEAAVLKKPIFFYDYDYDSYMNSRDVYMDYEREIPSAIHKDAKSLIEDIEKGVYDYKRLESFLNKYVYTKSPHETEDMIDFIFAHRKK
ncbi:MAG: CDP-glycerol glycerophosphotransferase family protein [Anaerovoracaceae bacterium]